MKVLHTFVKYDFYNLGCLGAILKITTLAADLMSNAEEEKFLFKHQVWGSRKWASEEKGRDRFSTQTLQQRWLLCQAVPHQFEEVESAPGRLRLTRAHSRRRSLSRGARTFRSAASLPSTATCISTHFTRFSLGASQGAAGAWGFHLWSCTPQTPGRWRRRPQPTPAVREESRG